MEELAKSIPSIFLASAEDILYLNLEKRFLVLTTLMPKTPFGKTQFISALN